MSETPDSIVHSEDYERLVEIYHSIEGDTLLHSLSTLLCSTNNSNYTAGRDAANVIHMQGHERRLTPSFKLTADYDGETVDQLADDVFKSNITQLINKYIGFIRAEGDEYKLKSLIVYLVAKKLYGILPELNFEEREREWLDKITNTLMEMKDQILQDMIDEFKSGGYEEHSEVTNKYGLSILSIDAGKSIAKYFSGLQEPIDHGFLYELLLHYKSLFRKVSKEQLGTIREIIDLSETTWNKRKNIIVKELQTLATDKEVDTINELIFKS